MSRLQLICSRKRLGVVLLSFGLLAGPWAVFAQTPWTNGEVIKIDQAAGKITIKHGPLKQFGMDEPMTMVYRADDPALFKNIKAGDKIKFIGDRLNGQFTITKIEKAR
jgi:Cu(I)/Ag(I) efflux system periplasmic protein CusF